DLAGKARGAQRVALAAGAAHAERVPSLQPRQSVVGLQKGDEHLVRGRRGTGATCRRHNTVRVGAVGYDTRSALERDAPVLVFDRCFTGADVAAALALGGR